MKFFLLLLLIVSTMQIIKAQNINFGIKAGVNYSGFNGKNEITSILNQKHKIGFNLGVFTKIEIQDRFFIQPELLFSLQGSSTGVEDIFISNSDGQEFLFKVKSDTNLYYLLIPVMGKYFIEDKVNVEFGPQIGYLLKGKLISKIKNGSDLPQDILENLGDEESDIEGSKTFDLGINLGLGYDFSDKLGIGLRYNYGLTKIFDRGSPFKNSVLHLNLSYNFNE